MADLPAQPSSPAPTNTTDNVVAVDTTKKGELIEKLALLEVEIDITRKRMPGEVESLEKLLNSVDELNSLGQQRDQTKAELMAVIKVAQSEENFESQLKDIILEAYESSKNEPTFYVGVSGGSFPPLFVKVLRTLENIDWKKWLFFFCDERCVSSASPDSTFGTFRKLIDPADEKLPLSLNQFIAIDPSLKSSKVAEDYLSKMRQRFDKSTLPRFHVLFLGLGPDGHTCSLFPGHRLLKETTKWVAYISDSPKPPPERVTLTLPVLNAARLCVFVAQGEGKAQVIKEILEDNKPYPAAMVKPHSGKVVWLLDQSAASKLSQN